MQGACKLFELKLKSEIARVAGHRHVAYSETAAKLVSVTTAGVPLNVALDSSHRRSLWSRRVFFVCRFCISFAEGKPRLSTDVFRGYRRERGDGVDGQHMATCLAANR